VTSVAGDNVTREDVASAPCHQHCRSFRRASGREMILPRAVPATIARREQTQSLRSCAAQYFVYGKCVFRGFGMFVRRR